MASTERAGGIVDTVWNFFASISLTIALLLSLALTSIIGTLIPQNADPAEYFKAFGDFYYRFFHALGLFDMYHSWWFQLLLLLLTLNVVICSIDRLSAGRKILFVRRPKFAFERFSGLKSYRDFTSDHPPEDLEKRILAVARRRFAHTQLETVGDGFRIFGERGRWTRFGVYTVHFSVVLLLVGGLIGSLLGFEGFVNIAEGDTVHRIRLRNSPQSLTLGFAVRCDDFDVSFYESGAPREFRSSLTILEDGKPVLQKDIIVNDPLRYKGINFFQSSYGPLPPDGATLSFTSAATGMIYRRQATIGQAITLPEDLGTFELKGFSGDAEFRGHKIGDAFVGVLTTAEGEAREIILPTRFPSFDKMRRGAVVVAVEKYTEKFYTGLQVTKDPGVWVVYCGFVLMILGCYITFFMSHQQYCIDVEGRGSSRRVRIFATANKGKTALPQKIGALAKQLALVASEEKR